MNECFIEQFELCDHQHGLTIFDVGASFGQTAEVYAALVPNCKLHCFEPFLDAFTILAKNCSHIPNISFINKAVSDVDGEAMLYVNSSSLTNSLLETDNDNAHKVWGNGLLETKYANSVSTITLDSYISEKQIPYVDILKIDVQGAENKVLLGASKSFSERKIGLVYTEIITASTYINQVGYNRTIELMDSFRYDLLKLYNHSYDGAGQLRQVDALFVPRVNV